MDKVTRCERRHLTRECSRPRFARLLILIELGGFARTNELLERRNTLLVLRTPDKRFDNLPDFPFEPHYAEINGRRVHYINEGQGETILCLHGEPTWSFVYRKIIPLLAANHRVLAMDFIGFGRSDKFVEREAYSFQMHYDTLVGFIEKLALEQITLVVHDWGGPIGLTVASEMVERFSRLVIMNTLLAIRGTDSRLADWPSDTGGTVHGDKIAPEVIAGYEAPFPDASYKAGQPRGRC